MALPLTEGRPWAAKAHIPDMLRLEPSPEALVRAGKDPDGRFGEETPVETIMLSSMYRGSRKPPFTLNEGSVFASGNGLPSAFATGVQMGCSKIWKHTAFVVGLWASLGRGRSLTGL